MTSLQGSAGARTDSRSRSVLSRLSRQLFEPSVLVRDVALRRHARLLGMIELTYIVQLTVAAVACRLTTSGTSQQIVPIVLAAATPLVFLAYLASRTEYVRLSAWTFLFVSMGLVVAIPFLIGTASDAPPIWGHFVFLTPSVLVAGGFGSARAPLIAGGMGLSALLLVIQRNGPPRDSAEIPQAIFFVALIVTLTTVLSVHRDKIEADRASELHARNDELEALRRSLEGRVAERTAELRERNAAMRLVFDNVEEGLFTVDGVGVISSQHSSALSRWFGDPKPGELFVDYFGRQSPEFAENAAIGWDQLKDGFLGTDLALDQMPKHLVGSDRHYRLSYRPIEPAEEGGFLAVVADVTSDIQREILERENRETFALFKRTVADRPGFVTFMNEARHIVDAIMSEHDNAGERARAVHTLKGNSMLFGIESVAAICHDLESAMTIERDGGIESSSSATEGQLIEELAERWTRLEADVDILLGERRDVVELTREQYAALERGVREGSSRRELWTLLQEMRLDPVERRLQHYAAQAGRIAQRLGKQIDIEVSHGGIGLDGQRWAPFWGAFVHAVRNAVDHGIEAPEARKAAGKAAAGHLFLRASRSAGILAVEIEDDGRGIDWEAIRARCKARGLAWGAQQDLVEALFADGVSTAAQVNELSGRGLGMGALRTAVHDLGGALTIESRLGAGTRLSMTFPIPDGNRPSAPPPHAGHISGLPKRPASVFADDAT